MVAPVIRALATQDLDRKGAKPTVLKERLPDRFTRNLGPQMMLR
jgi:hypothetical protein